MNCVLMICDVQFVHVSKRTFLHAMRNPATSLLQVPQTYFSVFNKTSCCSTDNEKPHRWWHLPNNFGPRRKLPMLCNGPKEPPPPTNFHSFFSEGPGLHLPQTASRLVQSFYNSSCDQQTHRDYATSVFCSSRPN